MTGIQKATTYIEKEETRATRQLARYEGNPEMANAASKDLGWDVLQRANDTMNIINALKNEIATNDDLLVAKLYKKLLG